MSLSDDDVMIIDSSSTDDSYDDDPTGEWQPGATQAPAAKGFGSATATLNAVGHPEMSTAVPPRMAAPVVRAPAVNVGTSTESELPDGLAAEVRDNLIALAGSIGGSARQALAGVKRGRGPALAAPWEETLHSVKRMCAERFSGGAETTEATSVQPPAPLADPMWLPQLMAVLASAAAEPPMKREGSPGDASSLPQVEYLLSATAVAAPQDDRADSQRPGPSRPVARGSRGRDDGSALTADEQRLLSEARAILGREAAGSLLPVYAELGRLRRQDRATAVRASDAAAARISSHETLLRLMLAELQREVRAEDRAFRRDCREVATGGSSEDGSSRGSSSADAPAASLSELHRRMEALRDLKQQLAALRVEAGHDERQAAAAVDGDACDAPSPHGHGHGGAFAAFNEAQLRQQEDLRAEVRALSAQLRAATAAADGWQSRYAAASSQLSAREAAEGRTRVPREAFVAFRSQARDNLRRLAATLGWDMVDLTGWTATLRQRNAAAGATGDVVVVDTSTGEVLSGALTGAAVTAAQPAAVPPSPGLVPAAPTHEERDPTVLRLPPSILATAAATPRDSPDAANSPVREEEEGGEDEERAQPETPLPLPLAMVNVAPRLEDLPPVPVTPAVAPASEPEVGSADSGEVAEASTPSKSDTPTQEEESEETVPFSNEGTFSSATRDTTAVEESTDDTTVNATGSLERHSASAGTPPDQPGENAPPEQIVAAAPGLAVTPPLAVPPPAPASPSSVSSPGVFAENGLWDDENDGAGY